MVIALSSLKLEFDAIRHQILTNSASPTIKYYFKRLLNMTGAHGMSSSFHVIPLAESLALVSQASIVGGNRGRNDNRSRPQCTFCEKLGHLEDKCWKKHGRPAALPVSSASVVHVFQSDPSPAQSPLGLQLVPMSAAEYDAFLKFWATQQSHPGNPVTCVAQDSSVSP